MEERMTKVETFGAGAAPFKTRYENYIGGKWVAPKSGRYMANISPITGQVVCEVPQSSGADMAGAFGRPAPWRSQAWP